MLRPASAFLLIFAAAALAGCQEETVQPEPEPETEPEPEPEPEPQGPLLTLNDVSVLIPPADFDAPGYLQPTSAGAKGELLPEEVYGEIPGFPVEPSQGLQYENMRVLGIRFDGCFPMPNGCEAQIRLVMQPVTSTGSTRDSALHLFYRLDEAELEEVVTELRRLRGLAPEVEDGPLDVHPALVAQGVAGAYGTALNEVVLRFAGKENLTRMTFFLRAPPLQEVWFFGGFDRENGELSLIEIPDVSPTADFQQVIRTDVAEGYDYQVNPTTSVPLAERRLLTSVGAEAATEEQRADGYAAYLRVQSPVHNPSPDPLSCAGCHLATFVLDQTRTTYGLDPAGFTSDAFASENHDLSLRGKSVETSSSLRAFGWFKRDPMIAQRVVNESAMVVDDLENRFPRPLE